MLATFHFVDLLLMLVPVAVFVFVVAFFASFKDLFSVCFDSAVTMYEAEHLFLPWLCTRSLEIIVGFHIDAGVFV